MHGYQTEVPVKEVARFLIQVKNLNRRSANLVFIPKLPLHPVEDVGKGYKALNLIRTLSSFPNLLPEGEGIKQPFPIFRVGWEHRT